MKLTVCLILTCVFTVIAQGQPFEVNWIWKKELNNHTMGLKIDSGKVVYDKLFATKTNGLPEDKWLDPVRLTPEGWVDLSERYRYSEEHRYKSLVNPKYTVKKLKGDVEKWELKKVFIVEVKKGKGSEGGVIVNFGNERSLDGPYFIWAPMLKGVAERDEYEWYIRRMGTYEYYEYEFDEKPRTIRMYAYGLIPETEETWELAINWLQEKYAKPD